MMNKINLCLKLIGFGVSLTPLNFQDKYYEFGTDSLETKGLEIGGQKADFLESVVAY